MREFNFRLDVNRDFFLLCLTFVSKKSRCTCITQENVSWKFLMNFLFPIICCVRYTLFFDEHPPTYREENIFISNFKKTNQEKIIYISCKIWFSKIRISSLSLRFLQWKIWKVKKIRFNYKQKRQKGKQFKVEETKIAYMRFFDRFFFWW